MNEEIQAKIDSLLVYRDALDAGERELFDMLISCAREVATTIENAHATPAGV